MAPFQPQHLTIGDIPALIWRGSGVGSRPAIISIHGGGGSKADIENAIAQRVVGHGVTLVTIDAYQHGERTSAGFDLRQVRANLPEFYQIIEHTARDLFTVVDFLRDDPAIDSGRIGLRGGSMGGYIVLMAVGLGVPAAAVLSICGGANYSLIWGLGDERAPGPYPDLLRRVRETDPIYHAQAFAPRPILLVHGARDPIVPIAGQRALYDELVPLYVYADRPESCLMLVHAGEHATPASIEELAWEWLVHAVMHAER